MTCGGGSNSRRQSNVPRYNDNESVSSLQGSLRVKEYSPKSSQRKQLCRTPLYLNTSEHSRTSTMEQDADAADAAAIAAAAAAFLSNTPNQMTLSNQHQFKAFMPPPSSLLSDELFMMHHHHQSFDGTQKRRSMTPSMFRPHDDGGGSSSTSRNHHGNDEYRAFLSTFDLNYNVANRLRESKSLDTMIPIKQNQNVIINNNNSINSQQLRHRDAKRSRQIVKRTPDQSACSSSVSMISRDPMPSPNFELGSRLLCTAENDRSMIKKSQHQRHQKNAAHKEIVTQNNGPTMMVEEAQCPLLPLLYRQNSLNTQDEDCVLQQKRWRSLETVPMVQSHLRGDIGGGVGGCGDTDTSAPKKTVNRGTIRSWLVNLFQGNGFSDASLRKAGVVQNRSFKGSIKGFSGVSELPTPEHESIV